MKHLFVVNPAAGKGKGTEYIHQIKAIFEGKEDYYIEVTEKKGQATEIVRNYTSKEDYIVYAIGGDGTINEVVNGMAGSRSRLAIIPAGSGNDFIRTIYPRYDKEELLHKLLNGKTENIDLVKVNEKYFLNIVSVGIDAEVAFNVEAFKRMRYIKGNVAYLLSIFKTLFGYKCTKLRVMLDGKETCDKKVLLLAVANGKFYGGGIPIAPHADVNDAMADVCLVKELKLGKILTIIPKLFKARHEEVREVEVYRAGQIEIESDEAFRVNIDGEIFETSKVNMQVMPQAIQVVVPAS